MNDQVYRKKILIDSVNVAGAGLKDFPVLVELSDADLRSRERGGHVGDVKGSDIFFTAPPGDSALPHEMEKYDPESGAFRAWVRLPELSAERDTVFFLCCGASGNRPPREEGAVWGSDCRVAFPATASGSDYADSVSLSFSDAVTVEAWIESDSYQAEALQAVVSKWRISESFDRFEGYDASNTGGLDTRGFFGAVFDGRYVYFVPQKNGTEHHGNVLRYDTHGEFTASSSWSAYNAGVTSGLRTVGYYGGVFDGRYVFFIPRTDGTNYHTRVLRYDTHGDFTSPESWRAHDAGYAFSCQNAAFDGRYLYWCPGYEQDKTPNHCSRMLRYDTHGALSDPESYVVYDAANTGGLDIRCFDGALFDGRYVYFVPLDVPGKMLRYDTSGGFTDRRSWQAFDAAEVSGLKTGACVGATFDGRYVYYAPYANSVVMRFDTRRRFMDGAAWAAYDAGQTSGLTAKGYDGAIFDGRYVYFIPFWQGDDVHKGFHGIVLRYDTQGDFTDGSSWQAADAGKTSGLDTVGFNGGAFDGRFIYMAPWRSGTTDKGGVVAHGNVLRYDTVGEDASFSLRAVDFGHNGGLCGAVPGPSFLVNTERGVLNVRANRNLSPGRHHLAGVYDGRRITLYVDGVPIAEQSGTGRIRSCDARIAIGRIQDGLGRFDGRIQEVRIANVARDPGWIATTYRNISSPRSFLRIVGEELT